MYICIYIFFMSCKTQPSCTVCNVAIICWTLKNIKIKQMLFDTLPFGMVSFRHSDLLSSRCVWVELIWLFWCLMIPVFICFRNLKPDINDRFMFPVADRCWKVYRLKRRKWRTAGQLFELFGLGNALANSWDPWFISASHEVWGNLEPRCHRGTSDIGG